MKRPIGYYVHHHGAGHLHRALLISGALKRPCTLIGTFSDIPGERDVVSLADDRIDAGFGGQDGAADRPEAFHYAPVDHAAIRTRMSNMAAWIAAREPALMVVDVSVEVALFARLLSVPVAMMRLAGRRNDQAHLEAFRAAEALIAPFPAAFENATTPPWVKAKTIYAGILANVRKPHSRPSPNEIVVVLGRGGEPMQETLLREAAQATPAWRWSVLGLTISSPGPCPGVLPSNLRLHGWSDEIGDFLDRAGIVIGGAGDGLLSAVAAREKKFICLPEARPFDEQVEKANVLEKLGLAVVLPGWPGASQWPAVLDRASSLDAAHLHKMHHPDAIADAAAAIEAIARRFDC